MTFLWAAAPAEFTRGVWSERRVPPPMVSNSRKTVDRLETALNNMAQGLVMFDAHERVVVCNDFYIRMYGLSREIVKPGCMLIDLLRHRIETGGYLNLDAEEYRRVLISGMAVARSRAWSSKPPRVVKF
jgi:PAS domain-containing protein